MPIPIILGGIALLSALAATTGVAKGAQGVSRFREAKKRGEAAQRRHRSAVARVLAQKKKVSERAQTYGRYLIKLSKGTLTEMRDLLTVLQQRPKAKKLRIPEEVGISVTNLGSFAQQVLDPPQDFLGAVSAASAGAAAGSGTVGLVGLLGTASTGTAISTLSGAAATNATLAWLGGGSLAAGGGGIALGTVVLGGVVAGPALAVTGFVLASKGEKALTKARRYEARINKAVAELEVARDFLERVVTRVEELDGLAKALNRRARAAMAAVDPKRFDPDDDEQMSKLLRALQLVYALSEVMQTPVLSKRGKLTSRSASVQVKYRELE